MSAWSSVRTWLGIGARRSASVSRRPNFRPTLEMLEARLPPGDVFHVLTNSAGGLTDPAWASGDLSVSATAAPASESPASTSASSSAPSDTGTAAAPGAAHGGSASSGASSGGVAASKPDSGSADFSDQIALASAARGAKDVPPPHGFIPPYLRPLTAPAPASGAVGAPSFSPQLKSSAGTPPVIPITNTAWSLIGPAPITAGQVPGSNPVSGRVAGIAADPTNANIIYMASAGGGVWKTTDAGATWAPLTDAQSTLFMGAIAVAPSTPTTIYAGTGESTNSILSFYGRGVLKSTDAGATWTLENNGGTFDRKTISKIVVDPTNANTVYAAVANGGVNGVGNNDGVWKSVDGGATWTNTTVAIPGVTGNSVFSDLVINQATPNTLFCAIGDANGAAENGVYVTVNGGTSWAAAGNFAGGVGDGNIKIDISRSTPNTVYASVADPATQGIKFIAKTIDGGTTWNNTTAPPNYLGGQGFYDSTIAVDPASANTVYVAGQQDNTGMNAVLETTDGGATWNDITIGVSGNDGPHTDHHAMAFDAAGLLLDGNDGGIWRLQNPTPAAIVWQDINSNLSTLQFIGIALHPTDANTAYGGTQDNGTDKFTGALPWTQVRGGDGGFVRVDPNNPLTVYHTFFRQAGSTTFIERSMDGGATWTDISAGINAADNSDFYTPYQMDQSNPNRLILGTDHLYETVNQGAAWTVIGTKGVAGFAINNTIDAIGLSQSSPNTIYVGDDQGNIFVTVNDGTTWTQHNIPAVTDHVNELVVDPANSNSVYAVRDRFGAGKVFHSADGGATWTDVSGNLPDLPTYSLALNTAANTLYVGNDNGVFASTDGGATWAVFGTGLPNVEVRELIFNSTLSTLAAGTHGRSVWEISTSTVVPPPPPPPPTPTPPATPGKLDANQTSDTATAFGPLLNGQTDATSGIVIAPLSDARNDYDWYRWDMGGVGIFSATEQTTAGGNLEMHLFTLVGHTLVEVEKLTTTGVASSTLSAGVAAGQVIFIEIKGQNTAFGAMSQGTYNLTATLT